MVSSLFLKYSRQDLEWRERGRSNWHVKRKLQLSLHIFALLEWVALVCKTHPSFQANGLYNQQLLSRFLKALLALAALPRPILYRWAVPNHSSSGKQNVSLFCCTHTRRDWFSKMAFKNELITTRNLSYSLMPRFSFVLVVTTRFSTLKLLRTLALWKQFLLPRAEKNYGDVNFMWSFYPTILS